MSRGGEFLIQRRGYRPVSSPPTESNTDSDDTYGTAYSLVQSTAQASAS